MADQLKKPEPLELTSQEKELIEFIRNLGYGDVTVIVQNGKPIRLEHVRQSIQLK